ncbi:unnamed protein product [Auanema sp. JU1783]|nr:unnamed protein product [Auanema sp. JU1783]
MLLQTIFLSSFIISSVICDCFSSKHVGEYCAEKAEKRFYYDPKYKCQPFQYRGCGGNGNNFHSLEECREKCIDGKTMSSTTSRNETQEFVPHGNSHDQWRKATECGSVFLIPNGKYEKCNPSCSVNHNCVNGVCCPTKEYVCSLRYDSGHFQTGIEDRPRFAWNHQTQACDRFSYYGVSGNYNNFPSFYSCVGYCKDAKPSH